MKIIINIFLCIIFFSGSNVYATDKASLHIDYFGNEMNLEVDKTLHIDFDMAPSNESIGAFYNRINTTNYQPLIDTLLGYKKKEKLNDWLYYQLIRRTAQAFSPKEVNYSRYTLYKWFLLCKSGYDATLALCKGQLVFYVHSDENVYDIPYYIKDGKQYVCLNSHDYTTLNFLQDGMDAVNIAIPEAKNAFSYKVTQMPDFVPADYAEKEIAFSYDNKLYHFKIALNKEVQNIFKNYPVVDYDAYFNIPLSSKTYSSFIPMLKQSVSGMKQKKGVDYLMRFTRNAFLYEPDQQHFGKEKRLSPEQTLLYDYSDCDDRAGLFFYLVKEIYDLPMIVLLYPTHVTIAVNFDNPEGRTITYKGKKYSVCEPTPQREDLKVGEISSDLRHTSYQIAYEYQPRK